jgi:hypothetical protein
MALVADALAAVREQTNEAGETEPDWPDADWQREVLEQVLPQVAPGKSDRELLKLAATDWRAHPGAAAFYASAEAVVGDIIRAN